jgi:hypothetical protein
MGVNLAESMVVFSVLAFVAFLIWNRTQSGLERRRQQLDAQARILEKIGPGQAMVEFLKTDEGRRFFNQLTAPHVALSGSKDTRKAIFVLTTMGLIALSAGFFFVMAVSLPTSLVENPTPTGAARFVAFLPVFLLTGAGVGALLAAWIMHRLAKKWGMLKIDALDDTAK